ncbi:hypothetical protein KIPB_012154, partial [Kipferlia bialata]
LFPKHKDGDAERYRVCVRSGADEIARVRRQQEERDAQSHQNGDAAALTASQSLDIAKLRRPRSRSGSRERGADREGKRPGGQRRPKAKAVARAEGVSVTTQVSPPMGTVSTIETRADTVPSTPVHESMPQEGSVPSGPHGTPETVGAHVPTPTQGEAPTRTSPTPGRDAPPPPVSVPVSHGEEIDAGAEVGPAISPPRVGGDMEDMGLKGGEGVEDRILSTRLPRLGSVTREGRESAPDRARVEAERRERMERQEAREREEREAYLKWADAQDRRERERKAEEAEQERKKQRERERESEMADLMRLQQGNSHVTETKVESEDGAGAVDTSDVSAARTAPHSSLSLEEAVVASRERALLDGDTASVLLDSLTQSMDMTQYAPTARVGAEGADGIEPTPQPDTLLPLAEPRAEGEGETPLEAVPAVGAVEAPMAAALQGLYERAMGLRQRMVSAQEEAQAMCEGGEGPVLSGEAQRLLEGGGDEASLGMSPKGDGATEEGHMGDSHSLSPTRHEESLAPSEHGADEYTSLSASAPLADVVVSAEGMRAGGRTVTDVFPSSVEESASRDRVESQAERPMPVHRRAWVGEASPPVPDQAVLPPFPVASPFQPNPTPVPYHALPARSHQPSYTDDDGPFVLYHIRRLLLLPPL